MADGVDDQVPADPAGSDVPHPDPVTEHDAISGGEVVDPAHGLPAGPEGEAVVAATQQPEVDDHGHGGHGHAAHGHHDDHGHDDHGHEGPTDDAWVLLPIGIGLVIGIVLVVIFGLATDAAPFV